MRVKNISVQATKEKVNAIYFVMIIFRSIYRIHYPINLNNVQMVIILFFFVIQIYIFSITLQNNVQYVNFMIFVDHSLLFKAILPLKM